jgi:hypothetical protein
MTRHVQDLTTCYVGVAFYRSTDNETLQTSVAQVFNERGDGVIVRGAQATRSQDDRQPHLTGDDAKDLLEQSLTRYRTEYKTADARVMLHKTSSFTPDELEGFQAAAEAERLAMLELVWIPREDSAGLFRQGEQSTLRGTPVAHRRPACALHPWERPVLPDLPRDVRALGTSLPPCRRAVERGRDRG